MSVKRYESKYSRFISEAAQDESRWSDEKEIMDTNKFVDIESGGFDSAGIPFISDGKSAYVNAADDHCLIYGSTGSKKTRTFVLPMVGLFLNAGESVVCTDPKGEIYANSSDLARKLGYNVIVLNFRNFANGDGYNPFSEIYNAYHDNRQDEAMEQIDDFVSAIAAEEKNSRSDPFWYRTASQLAVAHALLLMEIADKDTANISSFTHLCLDDNHEKIENLSSMMSRESIAGMNYRCVYGEPEKTRMSTQATLTGMIQPFLSNTRLQNMLSETTFDMGSIGRKKTIVYIILSDEKPTYYFLVGMFIKQLYERLISEAQKEASGMLPVRVNYILDEFGSIPRIAGFESAITAARSRNIRYYLIVQSLGQLADKYSHTGAGIIKGNCTDWVFLTSKELPLLNEICELCGVRYGRPLISVSELQRLKKGKDYIEALVLNGRNYPFLALLPDISLYKTFDFKPSFMLPERKFGEYKVIDFSGIYRKIVNDVIECPFSRRAVQLRSEAENKRPSTDAARHYKFEQTELQKELERHFNDILGNFDDDADMIRLSDLFDDDEED